MPVHWLQKLICGPPSTVGTMDCAICYDEITSATGRVEMSCTHTFHFHCLTKWFFEAAKNGVSETCPCCRKEANEHEGLPEEESVSESESSESEDSEWESPVDPEEIARARQHFVLKRSELSEDALKTYAAIRIQAVMRAYPPRMDWARYKIMLNEKKYLTNRMKELTDILKDADLERKTFMQSITMSRSNWRSLCATKIQAAWRGAVVRRGIGLRVTWVEKDGVWTRSIAKTLEKWQPSDGLPPQSLAFQMHAAGNRNRIESLVQN